MLTPIEITPKAALEIKHIMATMIRVESSNEHTHKTDQQIDEHVPVTPYSLHPVLP